MLDSQSTEVGYGAHTLQVSVEDLCQDLDPLLVQRKGRLILLATENADPQALAWICRDYYGSRSFDAIPTLLHSLSQAYRDHADLHSRVPLLAVQRGLDVYIVGSAEAVVRLARYSVVRDLFDPLASQRGFRVSLTEHPGAGQIPALYSTVWRVVKGDLMLLTNRSAADKISAGALSRVARQAKSAGAAARSLERTGRVGADTPLMAIRFAQISPVPEVPEPARSEIEPAPVVKPRMRREGASPVLVAGLIALVAVLVSVWATGTRIDLTALPGYLQLYFFPEPTPTAGLTPVVSELEGSEQSFVYSPPELVAPYNGARITGSEVALVWEWMAELGPDERFEVLLQPPGGEPEARTMTRERQHVVTFGAEGWYSWTVRLVDVSDSAAPVALSSRAEQVSFHWSAGEN